MDTSSSSTGAGAGLSLPSTSTGSSGLNSSSGSVYNGGLNSNPSLAISTPTPSNSNALAGLTMPNSSTVPTGLNVNGSSLNTAVPLAPVDTSGNVNASAVNTASPAVTGATVNTSNANSLVSSAVNTSPITATNTGTSNNGGATSTTLTAPASPYYNTTNGFLTPAGIAAGQKPTQANDPYNTTTNTGYNAPTTPQATADQQEIQSLMTQLGYKGTDYTNMENQYNVPGLTQQVQDLTNTLNQKNAAYAQQFQQIGSQNIPSLFVSGQMALAKQAAAVDIASTSAQISALNGNITAAQNLINNAINTKYSGITDNLTNLQDYYKTVDAPQLAAAVDAQKVATANNQTLTMQAQKDLLNQISIGQVDQATGYQAMSDLLNNKISIGDFYQKIGGASPMGSSATGNNNGQAIVQSVMNLIGAPNDMPVSQAITNYGITAITQALISNEGGSPSGVTNNPGNIKFAGLPGQTDSGVKATDGGTFASYKTPQAGQAAVQALVQKASDSGQNLSDFIAQYKGVDKNSTGQGTPTYNQYGLLSNVPDFNPNSQIDKSAALYLNEYIKNATLPTYYTLWGRQAGYNLSATAQRANDLYFKATGQSLPDVAILKSNKNLVSSNNQLANNLSLQEQTVRANVDLSLKNMNENGINSSGFLPLNNMINSVQTALQDPNTAQMISQNATLQNELGSLMAVKNASGTTVYDKLMSSGLIYTGEAPKDIAQSINTIMTEAGNFASAIKNVNGQLYNQIDPLQTDPNNPSRQQTINAPFAASLQKLNATDAGNNTINIPRANWATLNSTHDQASGLSQGDALIAALKAKGYTLKVI